MCYHHVVAAVTSGRPCTLREAKAHRCCMGSYPGCHGHSCRLLHRRHVQADAPMQTVQMNVTQMEKVMGIVEGQAVPLDMLPELTDTAKVQKVRHCMLLKPSFAVRSNT